MFGEFKPGDLDGGISKKNSRKVKSSDKSWARNVICQPTIRPPVGDDGLVQRKQLRGH